MNHDARDPAIQKTLSFLDMWIENMLKRPEAYVSVPEAIEDIILIVDQIKFRLLGTEEGPSEVIGYPAFLMSKGLGVGRFIERRRPRRPTAEDRSLFLEVAEFVKEYRQNETLRIDLNSEEWQKNCPSTDAD